MLPLAPSAVVTGCYQWHSNRVGKVQAPPSVGGPAFQAKKNKNNFTVTMGETFNKCAELHKNAFGSWALPGPAGGAIVIPQTI